MFSIDIRQFNKNTNVAVREISHGDINIGANWPIVYILNNSKEAYVGETVNASRRMEQHWKNKDRQRLKEVRIISDETFNKSTILDLESFLIRYLGADGKFILQNANNGIQDHLYYQKAKYQELFCQIWDELIKCGFAMHALKEIESSELFKYSPYKSLGEEQINSEKEILNALSAYGDSDNGVNIVVRGGAGTGKTILAIYLMKLISDVNNRLGIDSTEDKELLEEYLNKFEDILPAVENMSGIKKIGLVIPQSSLQKSLRDVFKSIHGLNKHMILSTKDVVDEYLKTGEKFDLLIVDEAHRLKCRYNGHLSSYKPFDDCNHALGLDHDRGTELDWIMTCSKNQILFRDELQTVRPCDITGDDFKIIIKKYRKYEFESALSTQWRCEGGNDYIDYLKNIFACKQQSCCSIKNYDLKLFENCDEMIDAIKQKEKEYGLCRVAAGFAWPWNGKKDKTIRDVVVQGKAYSWNTTYQNWISSKNAIDEIGCIHTLQGYDLNYAGIIIGEDIKYDPNKKIIYPDKTCYFDQQGKSGVANKPDELLEYLSNIYLTLLTRGIKGTYIYVCNNELREYLKQYFPVI